MKKLVVILFALITSVCSFAQGVTLTQEQIDSLPPSAKAAIQASIAKEETKENLKSVSEYAGLGKEVGEAVNSALGAVEDHVVNISKTDLGQTAIFIVCWKLLYKDIIGIAVGLLLLTIMCVWMWISIKFMKSDKFDKWHEDPSFLYISVCAIGWIILFIASMLCIF